MRVVVTDVARRYVLPKERKKERKIAKMKKTNIYGLGRGEGKGE